MQMSQQPRILCVDVDTEYLYQLEEVLQPRDYQTVLAQDGKTALAALRSRQIDLVLLDVMMPRVTDGFEVLRQIKEGFRGNTIPVLIVTTMNDMATEIRGLELGAADYLRKPISPAVLRARLQTHLAMKAYRDRMDELVKMYAQQMTHAERLSTLGTLTAGIAHEINSSLVYVLGFSSSLLAEMRKLMSRMAASQDSQLELLAACHHFLVKGTDRADRVTKGLTRIQGIMESMRKFSCREEMGKALISMNDCIDNALALCHNELKYHVTVHREAAPDLPPVMANGQQLEQVFVNLFKNAADAMDKNQKGMLEISLSHENGFIRCAVEDNGPGIEPVLLGTIWEPFFSTKGVEDGTGLGLPISREIIDCLQGRIWAENRELNAGARFVVELPAAAAKQG